MHLVNLARKTGVMFATLVFISLGGCKQGLMKDGETINDNTERTSTLSSTDSTSDEDTTNSAPTISTVTSPIKTTVQDTAVTISYAELLAAADEADADGDTVSFRIEAISTGTLTHSVDGVVTAGTTILAPGQSLTWTPASGATGSGINAFTIKAFDGADLSTTTVQVKVTVTVPPNNDPSITAISDQTGEIGASIRGISFTVDESDTPGTAEEDTQTLTITATSSNTTLIPNANIVINYTDNGASDASDLSPTIDVHPEPAQTGTATITVTVTDNASPTPGSVQTTFDVTISNPLSDVASGMVMWLKADGGLYEDVGGTNFVETSDVVQIWKDQSGNSTNVSRVNGNPTWLVSDSNSNNKPTVVFTGDVLRSATGATTGNQPHTMIVVASVNSSPSTWHGLVNYSGSNSANQNSVIGYGSADQFWIGGFGQGAGFTGSTMTPSTYHVVSKIYDGSLSYGYFDSVFDRKNAVTYNLTSTDIGIGYQYWNGSGGSQGAQANISEVLIFSRTLSISERQKIEAYLGNKYGVRTIPTANQQLWLKADVGVKSDACGGTDAVNNDSVACWEDQSGSGNNASAVVAPNFASSVSIANSQPALAFNGGTQRLSGNIALSNDASFFGAFTAAGLGSWKRILSTQNYFYFGALGAQLTTFYGNGTGWGIAAAHWNGAALSTGTSHVISSIQEDSIDHPYKNGIVVDPRYNPLSNFSSTYALGAKFDGDQSWNGTISEVLAYDGGMTETNRQRTELYLAKKYAASYTTHPVLDGPGLALWLKADSGITLSSPNAAQFTRANSEYLSIADNASLSAGDIDFTIAGWVYLNDKVAGNIHLISKWTGGSNTAEYALYYKSSGDRISFAVTNDGSAVKAVDSNALGSPSTGQWYFVIAYHDSSADRIGISVNSLATTTTSHSGGVYDGVSDFTISGCIQSDGVTMGQLLDGGVSRVGVWKRLLTSDEKAELYNNGKGLRYADLSTALKTNLEGYWNLDEASGTRTDLQGSNDLTDNNTVTTMNGPSSQVSAWADQSPFGNNAAQVTASKQPIYITDGGSAFNNLPVIRFDGNSDALSTAALNLNTKTYFIVAKRALATTPSTNEWLLSHIVDGNNRYGFVYASSGRTETHKRVSGSQYFANAFGTEDDTRYIIVSEDTETQISFRLNGTGYGPSGSVASAHGGGVLHIGSYDGSNLQFGGDVAEVIMYTEVLTSSQRQAIECYLSNKYNVGLPGC